MIPLSMKEFVEYTDTDGIVFRFKPKGAILEREQMDIWKEGETVEQYRDDASRSDIFRVRQHVDEIVIDPYFAHLMKVA